MCSMLVDYMSTRVQMLLKIKGGLMPTNFILVVIIDLFFQSNLFYEKKLYYSTVVRTNLYSTVCIPKYLRHLRPFVFDDISFLTVLRRALLRFQSAEVPLHSFMLLLLS